MWEKVCAGMLGAMMITGTAGVSAAGVNKVQAEQPVAVTAKAPAEQAQAAQQKEAPEATTATAAQAAAEPAKTTGEEPAQVQKKEEPLKISINLAARSLALYRGAEKVRLYPIAPGKASTPTPTGYYKVREKEVNPTWTDPETGVSIPTGPECPLGYRWIGVQGNIGIHGTNNPSSIGTYASHGCMRMFEKDVEELYSLVSLGTPIEITYNRVVVEKAPADDTVVYYIYPDAYGWQKVSTEEVHKWLAGYGVGNFVSDEEIDRKIAESDGNPTYVGKVYPLYVNGKRLKNNAVEQDGVTYLPAIDLADAVKVNLGWLPEANTLVSTFGKAEGFDKRDVLYCKDKDVRTLFHLAGGIDKDKHFTLAAVSAEVTENKLPVAEEKKAEGKAEQKEEKPVLTDGSASKKSLTEIYQEATK
ncbi:Lipoprotein-anchoring transpeptidase ErfK/SrfK [Selenomonas sp. GACV-9]|uniref:L,D-transpeptidase n=1 Tax=Selenomonas sp. GACV-9 TaxID=3158782 RepID=UPI0008EAD1AD|nr:Lipoprotein-anchoring transpeptidase ErfK/SrfK [Selenomonas ruminantium]